VREQYANIRTQLLGQAGVWTVAAQLAIRNHVPCFPGVDHGYDLMIENGLRIQVKASRLSGRKHGLAWYPEYKFNVRRHKVNMTKRMCYTLRDWTKDAEFFVLWGIDENRFWIVPTADVTGGMIYFASSISVPENPRMKGGLNPQYAKSVERRASYEGRWDLLDVDTAVQALVEATKENI
jgi:hypothetical protein